jgi:hypothetical protein
MVHFEVRTKAAVFTEAAGSIKRNLTTLLPPVGLEVAAVFTLPLPSSLNSALARTLFNGP